VFLFPDFPGVCQLIRPPVYVGIVRMQAPAHHMSPGCV
jgi:hypothetical protein